MSILEQGCMCNTCLESTIRNLETAQEKWWNGEREIVFKPYYHTCGDGCCDDYGTDVYVNGFKISSDGENVESVINSLFEFLDIQDVSVSTEHGEI